MTLAILFRVMNRRMWPGCDFGNYIVRVNIKEIGYQMWLVKPKIILTLTPKSMHVTTLAVFGSA